MSDIALLHRARSKKRHEHRWATDYAGQVYCDICLLWQKDYEARQRRGRSAARLGKDQERGFEKEHGPRKIGEFGDPVDHIGAFGKYQVKSTRRPVSARLRHLDRMDAYYLDKVPVLVERFVRVGVRTETFVTLRLRDWQALHGRDELQPSEPPEDWGPGPLGQQVVRKSGPR